MNPAYSYVHEKIGDALCALTGPGDFKERMEIAIHACGTIHPAPKHLPQEIKSTLNEFMDRFTQTHPEGNEGQYAASIRAMEEGLLMQRVDELWGIYAEVSRLLYSHE